jgi:hypothetical protein
MFNRKHLSGRAGIYKLSAMAVVIGLIFAMMMGASAPATHAASSASGYFPDQFVNQAKEIEPMIDTYGDTGLSNSFPDEVVSPDDMIDAAPQMYS